MSKAKPNSKKALHDILLTADPDLLKGCMPEVPTEPIDPKDMTNAQLLAYELDPDYADAVDAVCAAASPPHWAAMASLIEAAPDAWRFARAAAGGDRLTLILGKELTIEFERWSQGWTFMTFVDDTGRDAEYRLEISMNDEIMMVQDIVRTAGDGPVRHGRRLPDDPELHAIDKNSLSVMVNGKALPGPTQ